MRYCSIECRGRAQVVTDRPTCSACGEREARAKGLCFRCWERDRNGRYGVLGRPTVCTVEGCGQPVECRTWCRRHYRSWRKYGDPAAVEKPVEYVDHHGYLARRGGVGSYRQRMVHNLVMAEALGRDLEPGEVVHHVNGDKLVNLPENLHLFESQSQHKAAHQSLERAAFVLMAAGLIEFDRVTGLYRVAA